MVEWQFFPKSDDAPDLLKRVLDCFKGVEDQISSKIHKLIKSEVQNLLKYPPERYKLTSNEVLKILRNPLAKLGFQVEQGKKTIERIRVPVLFGRNGKPEKSFGVDTIHRENGENGTVVEIEAGRGLDNNQFLKDLFEACMMYHVKYLVIAVKLINRTKNKTKIRTSKDFEKVVTFFETMYTSGRLKLPLQGILLIGY